MNLLDLPTELVRLIIVQHLYGPWSVHLRPLAVKDKDRDAGGNGWRFEATGLPPRNLQLTCRVLGEMAAEAERASFTGRMYITEDTSVMSPTYRAFVEAAEAHNNTTTTNGGGVGLEWLRCNVTALRLSNPEINPAVWRFVHALYSPVLPRLRRIELDCRYHYHFAVHNVGSCDDFFSREYGRLERLIDYRQSFFLGCERFLLRAVRSGLAVQVIRNMGVREGNDRCRAVVRPPNPRPRSVFFFFFFFESVLTESGRSWQSIMSQTRMVSLFSTGTVFRATQP